MTNEQVESMFISISKSIAQLDDKLTGIDGRLDGIDTRLVAVELGQEQMRGDIRGVAEGVSFLLERREEDEVWRAEMTARVLKLEAEVHAIEKHLLTA